MVRANKTWVGFFRKNSGLCGVDLVSIVECEGGAYGAWYVTYGIMVRLGSLVQSFLVPGFRVLGS